MKTAISFKIDTDVRNRARIVAKKIGVPLSMVVNQQLKQFANNRSIEFYEPLIPNARLEKFSMRPCEILKKVERTILARIYEYKRGPMAYRKA